MERSGAELIVRSLKEEGVKHLFGVSSTAVLPLLDVIYHHPEVRYVQAQHEQGGMYMANGYARVSRSTGVCLVGSGPAITNCISGVAQAYHTAVPSLLIGIEDGTGVYGLGSSLHHGLDAVSVLKPVTKLAIRVERAARITDLMRMAFCLTQTGRRGPVYLGIPGDILYDRVDDSDTELVSPEHSRITRVPRADPQDLARAAEVLVASERPVILAGGEVTWAQAEAELLELAELLAIPIIAMEGEKGVVPEDHPLALGVLSVYDAPLAAHAMRDADVILAVGSPFSQYTTLGFRHRVIPKGARIIQIDADPAEVGKIYPVTVGVVGDIRNALQHLLIEVKERQGGRNSFMEVPRIQNLLGCKREQHEALVALAARPSKLVTAARLILDLRKALPREAIVVGESGGTHVWFEYGFEALAPTYGLGSWHPMGAEYSEMLGAKLAMPDRKMVCLLGDGSLMMALPELATAGAYGIPLLAVVRHNNCFGNMRDTQSKRYGGRFIGTDIPVPHLTNIARECGLYAERIEEQGQILQAVKRALESGWPALLEVMMDPAPENLFHPSGISSEARRIE